MKTFLFSLVLLTTSVAYSQDKNQYVFDIIWADQTTSRIKINEFVDGDDDAWYYSIVADGTIEINGKYDETLGKVKLNRMCTTESHEGHGKNDTTLFYYEQEIFLNYRTKDIVYHELYYTLDAMEEGCIKFRKRTDTTQTGTINIYGLHFEKCTFDTPGGCMQSKHIPEIDFQSYTFSTTDVLYNIDLKNITGVEKKSRDNNIKVFPNPFSSNLTIATVSDQQFSLYSLNGKVLLTDIEANLEVNLSGLNKGVYILKSEDGLFTKMITKF